MTVFKTFFKIVNKYKFTILLYTVMLIIFAGFNMQTSDNSMSFVASKPDVLIANNDENRKLTNNLVNYIESNCNIIDIEDTEEARNDALFYRDVNYIIYIPENYSRDFLDGLNPEIEIKSTGNGESSYAEMMLTRYIKIANIYQKETQNEEELIDKINNDCFEEHMCILAGEENPLIDSIIEKIYDELTFEQGKEFAKCLLEGRCVSNKTRLLIKHILRKMIQND